MIEATASEIQIQEQGISSARAFVGSMPIPRYLAAYNTQNKKRCRKRVSSFLLCFFLGLFKRFVVLNNVQRGNLPPAWSTTVGINARVDFHTTTQPQTMRSVTRSYNRPINPSKRNVVKKTTFYVNIAWYDARWNTDLGLLENIYDRWFAATCLRIYTPVTVYAAWFVQRMGTVRAIVKGFFFPERCRDEGL